MLIKCCKEREREKERTLPRNCRVVSSWHISFFVVGTWGIAQLLGTWRGCFSILVSIVGADLVTTRGKTVTLAFERCVLFSNEATQFSELTVSPIRVLLCLLVKAFSMPVMARERAVSLTTRDIDFIELSQMGIKNFLKKESI